MALDLNAIKFLFWAKNLGVSFNRTATLGRLGLSCSRRKLRQAIRNFRFKATAAELDRCFEKNFGAELYADEFLRFLGTTELVTVDRSNYEGATLLHDLNYPFPVDLHNRFDLMLDGGTLEHIFDYPAAMRNVLKTISVGGHFITITPANQFMGHGFYQFSPELFFRIFSKENGFELRKIILFECWDTDAAFYEVTDPAKSGWRVQLVKSHHGPVLLAALARKTADVPLFSPPPQQSDYVVEWSRGQKALAGINVENPGLFHRARVALNPYWPFWLRYLKARLQHYRSSEGPPSLRNKRHFRRLTHEEITGNKSGGN